MPVGQRCCHAKAYRSAKIVSNTIICPDIERGSERLARFQHALPRTDAKNATPADVHQKMDQSLAGCAWLDRTSVSGEHTSASSPVTRPVSSDQSCEQVSDMRHERDEGNGAIGEVPAQGQLHGSEAVEHCRYKENDAPECPGCGAVGDAPEVGSIHAVTPSSSARVRGQRRWRLVSSDLRWLGSGQTEPLTDGEGGE